MASRGRKDCPNCNTEMGVRCFLCSSCGYHFSSKEIRKDLLEKKTTPKETKTYTEPGQGRKTCPECSVIIAGVTKICPKCNFDFSLIQKEKKLEKDRIREEKTLKREEKRLEKERIKEEKRLKKEEKRDKKSIGKEESVVGLRILEKEAKGKGVMESIKYVKPVVLSPQDHAQRILGYGKERATILLKMHKWGGGWGHVDWNAVEKGLV